MTLRTLQYMLSQGHPNKSDDTITMSCIS